MGLPRDSQNNPISWKEFDYENEIPFPLLMRYKISKGKELKWKCDGHRALSKEQLDFGTLNPKHVGRPYRYVYALCGSHSTKSTPLQGFVKIDISEGKEWKWMPKPHEFIGEMTFIPRGRQRNEKAAEDDGYLMSYLFNGQTNQTSVILFDAQRIEEGPILRHVIKSTRLPIMLHGSYAPNLV